MLAGATRNSAGEPEKLLVQWLKKSEERDNTIIGTLTIKSDTLIVEVNSEKRYKKIQRAIEKRLGERAVLRKTEIMSAEEMMKQPRRGSLRLRPNRRGYCVKVLRSGRT